MSDSSQLNTNTVRLFGVCLMLYGTVIMTIRACDKPVEPQPRLRIPAPKVQLVLNSNGATR